MDSGQAAGRSCGEDGPPARIPAAASAALIVVLCLCPCLLAADDGGPSDAWTGRAVMAEQLRRHKPPCETAQWRMILTDRHGRRRERRLKHLRLTTEGDVDRTLLACLAPADVRGMTLVTREAADSSEAGQWIYLPSQRRYQRIAQGRRSSYVMGSDFTYEDLDPEDLDTFRWTLVGEETVDGHPCFVIEALPAGERESRRSAYAKRIAHVDRETFVTRQVEFFDRAGRACKRQTNRAFEPAPNGAIRAREMEMENRVKDHRTLLLVEAVDFAEPLDENHFSRYFVTSGRCLE